MTDSATVITGEQPIRLAQALARKHALALEILGIPHSSGSIYAVVKREYGLKGNKRAVHAQLEAMCNRAMVGLPFASLSANAEALLLEYVNEPGPANFLFNTRTQFRANEELKAVGMIVEVDYTAEREDGSTYSGTGWLLVNSPLLPPKGEQPA